MCDLFTKHHFLTIFLGEGNHWLGISDNVLGIGSHQFWPFNCSRTSSTSSTKYWQNSVDLTPCRLVFQSKTVGWGEAPRSRQTAFSYDWLNGLSWMRTGNPLLHNLQINGGRVSDTKICSEHISNSIYTRVTFLVSKKKNFLANHPRKPEMLPIHTSSMPASFSHFSPWWRSDLNWDDHSKTTHGFPVSECRSHLFLPRSRRWQVESREWMDG